MVNKIEMATDWLAQPVVPQHLSFRFFYCFTAISLFLSVPLLHAQSVQEVAVKLVIHDETEAWAKRDADAWQAVWIHSPEASRTIVVNNELDHEVGWDNFGPAVIKNIQENPVEKPREFRHHNYRIHISDEMAWVNFDQEMEAVNAGPGSSPVKSMEQRVLVVVDGRWKILSQTTYLPETFEVSPESTSANLISISDNLIADKKVNEAIELLELSAKIYPQSWETYHNLGDAYAEAGKKKRAISNYQKSLELNPENDEAMKVLAELE